MAVEASLPTLGVVIVTALIDSINPCAIGVLILLLSVLISTKKSVGQMLKLGLIYIASVYIVYFMAGLGLLFLFSKIPQSIAEYISMSVALLVVAAGLIEIKDFFWYGSGFSLAIPAKYAKKIHKLSSKTTTVGIIFLGAFVSAVELPCTGGPYLAIITLLSQLFDITAFLMLLLYNLIFVLPLIIIVCLVIFGKKIVKIKRWRHSNKGYMRLLIGLILIAMGWLLILIANGAINLG